MLTGKPLSSLTLVTQIITKVYVLKLLLVPMTTILHYLTKYDVVNLNIEN